jgi:hypothetical protein
MIEQLKESHGAAIGFKVTGKITAEDIQSVIQQIDHAIAAHKKPIGLLIDLTEMEGATWAARWAEMRFLQHHSDHIARLAVISNDGWEVISEMILVATAALQAETLYFLAPEIIHAWHWVKMNKLDESIHLRTMYPGKGLFKNYTPEYTGL